MISLHEQLWALLPYTVLHVFAHLQYAWQLIQHQAGSNCNAQNHMCLFHQYYGACKLAVLYVSRCTHFLRDLFVSFVNIFKHKQM